MTAAARKDGRDPAMRAAVVGVAGTALVLAVLATFGFGPWAGVGVAVGGSLATVNLILFQRIVGAFLEQKGNAAPWGVIGALKLLGLFAVAWIVLRTGLFSALSFAIGYASLPIGITVGSLLSRPRAGAPEEAAQLPPAPLPPSGEGSTPLDRDVVNGPRTE